MSDHSKALEIARRCRGIVCDAMADYQVEFPAWNAVDEQMASLISECSMGPTQEELDKAVRARAHTHEWYHAHYGKLEDWARKRLPEPWVTEFFNCVANGTWGHDDLGEPYMSQVGRIVPSGYFKMDSAAEQLLRDQTMRAEEAEMKLAGAISECSQAQGEKKS